MYVCMYMSNASLPCSKHTCINAYYGSTIRGALAARASSNATVQVEMSGSASAECAETVADFTGGQCNDCAAEPMLGSASQSAIFTDRICCIRQSLLPDVCRTSGRACHHAKASAVGVSSTCHCMLCNYLCLAHPLCLCNDLESILFVKVGIQNWARARLVLT